MARALDEQRRIPACDAMSFEERLGLLVDRKAAERDTRRPADAILDRLLYNAHRLEHAAHHLQNTHTARAAAAAIAAPPR
jgi:hypothetical protein